jgi:dihydroorotate dehydrogenase electron transfer subunit
VAVVSGVERLGAYDLITALDRFGPADPRPGQFYMLAAAGEWGGGSDERPYLPRAFSYARARAEDEGVALDFLLEAVGPGTERLSRLAPDEGLALVGPLGVGFRAPAEGTRPLLVGGGIGAAPLLCWQERLAAADSASGDAPAAVLLGFRTALHAQAAALFAGQPQVVTDDGSVGRQALVTELLATELDRAPNATIYACGPPAMLEVVRGLCAERGIVAELAMETPMACGFGSCFGCAVPLAGGGYMRLCVDGPTVRGDEVETALVETGRLNGGAARLRPSDSASRLGH